MPSSKQNQIELSSESVPKKKQIGNGFGGMKVLAFGLVLLGCLQPFAAIDLQA
ncbi:hypothetical protein BRADI_1g22553v3 [Brachypodium distachyon]|uniref:Uncharacterized protein n=1 Tax=Brachypodium distachyon TaxID=15368 RepID=A0A2K2DKL2_BRADI|nr:hypothetical protein BRADI_1g22553v3 [Brachypodium distachyon]